VPNAKPKQAFKLSATPHPVNRRIRVSRQQALILRTSSHLELQLRSNSRTNEVELRSAAGHPTVLAPSTSAACIQRAMQT